MTSGIVTTLVGNAALNGGPPNNYGHADGVGTAASFFRPAGIAMDGAGTLAVVVGLMTLLHGVGLRFVTS